MLTGAYLPGNSPLHRAPAGLKLAGLTAFLVLIALLRSPAVVTAGTLLLAGLAALARIGPRVLFAQVRPVLLFAVLVAAFQTWTSGPAEAAVVTGTLLLAVAGAGLVTVTTRTQDLLDAVVAGLRPLRRCGVDPQRAGLVLALAVRTVPVLTELAGQVQQARVARGAERSPRAFVVPLVIRAVRHADRLGEALAARGVDDP
ncbi:MAG TPA: energy-coupling factor transporter transmembrane protein EcfT [Kineosporiaceae bacterium]|nr:energy-coupling factor transporter transmembrane protein EcfT [Kineosporiaceae bacterium]